MNKYDKHFYNNELKYNKYTNIEFFKLVFKLYKYLLLKGDIKNLKEINYFTNEKANINEIIPLILFNLCFVDEELVKWIKENIINKLDTGAVMTIYIQNLCNQVTTNNTKILNSLMESFKRTGIIKNIEFNEKHFIITTLDNEIIKFSNQLKDEEQMREYSGMCHQISYEYFKYNPNDNIASFITIIEKNLVNNPRYHSILLYKTNINDLSRNIHIKFEDYIKLFKPKIVLNINGQELVKKIEELNNTDNEFKTSTKCNGLKYAMSKELKRD